MHSAAIYIVFGEEVVAIISLLDGGGQSWRCMSLVRKILRYEMTDIRFVLVQRKHDSFYKSKPGTVAYG